jgi:hypothetical protein
MNNKKNHRHIIICMCGLQLLFREMEWSFNMQECF